MEIELPDGTILEAPDDADVKTVVRGYVRARTKASNPAEYDPESPEFQAKYGPMARGTVKKPRFGGGYKEESADNAFTEGIGSGMKRMSAGLSNIAVKGINKHPFIKLFGQFPTPDYATDEALTTQDELDQPLAETTKGALGQAVGQTAVATGVTAPLGGLGNVARGGNILTRTMAGPTSRAALEGAVTGAGAASPDEQGDEALRGAILGATIERLMKGGGRAIKGLVKKSEAAENLEQIASQQGEEIFAPISQVASEGDTTSRLAKTLYAEGLSFIPGVKGQLNRQADDAAATVREIALREAAPDGVTIPKGAGKKVGETVHTIRQGFDDAYKDTVKSYAFNVPSTFGDDVEAAVRAAIPNVDDTTVAKVVAMADEQMTRFSSGKSIIDGDNLLKVKNEIGRLVGMAPRVEKPAMRIAQEQIEDIIEKELMQGGAAQNLADLARYGNLTEPYRHFVGLNKASRAARDKGGNFTMSQLAKAASDPAQLDLAQQAGAVLRNPAAGTSFTGRGLIGGAGLIGAGATVGAPAAAGLLIGGNVLATKTMQKALMGDLAAQRSIAKIIQKNPSAADQIARALRILAVQQSGDSNE